MAGGRRGGRSRPVASRVLGVPGRSFLGRRGISAIVDGNRTCTRAPSIADVIAELVLGRRLNPQRRGLAATTRSAVGDHNPAIGAADTSATLPPNCREGEAVRCPRETNMPLPPVPFCRMTPFILPHSPQDDKTGHPSKVREGRQERIRVRQVLPRVRPRGRGLAGGSSASARSPLHRRLITCPVGLWTVPRPAPVDECASRDAEPRADCHSYAKPGTALPQHADNRTQARSEREADPPKRGDSRRRGEVYCTAVRTFCAHPTGYSGVREGTDTARHRVNHAPLVPARTHHLPRRITFASWGSPVRSRYAPPSAGGLIQCGDDCCSGRPRGARIAYGGGCAVVGRGRMGGRRARGRTDTRT